MDVIFFMKLKCGSPNSNNIHVPIPPKQHRNMIIKEKYFIEKLLLKTLTIHFLIVDLDFPFISS